MQKRKLKHISGFRHLSMLFVLIITFQIVNTICWQHVHILADGSLVTHAHPYSKHSDSSPTKQHHHTKAEMLALDNLEILYPLLFLTALLLVLASSEELCIQRISFHNNHLSYFSLGRDPPLIH